jgi:hypothetical protein
MPKRSDGRSDSSSGAELRYFCDSLRHLVCLPYTVENLHRMAQDLGIKRCWFHSGASYAHYDVPKRRFLEIARKCERVSAHEILMIVKGQKTE